MDVGIYINKARKLKGLSQEDLANKLNVSRQCVSLWETNQTIPTLENMIAISEALEIKISILTGQEPFSSEGLDDEETKKQKERAIEENNHRVGKILTIFALILSGSSCVLFLIPILGFFVTGAGIILSIFAKKKEATLLNSLSLILGSVYFFASIVTLVNLFS